MEVPLNHPFIDGFPTVFHYKPTNYWGTPIYGNPHKSFMFSSNFNGLFRQVQVSTLAMKFCVVRNEAERPFAQHRDGKFHDE